MISSKVLARAVIAASCLFVVACGSVPDDCRKTFTCAGAGGGTGSSSSSMGSGAGGAQPGCDPTLGKPVDSTCGVFVSSSVGRDSNAGTKDAPVKTIAHASKLAGSGAIYLCGEAFEDGAVLEDGVTVFGALDCKNNWAWNKAKRSTIKGAPNAPAVTLRGDAEITDVDVAGADATKPGASSIGVLAQGGTVAIERGDITAGAGKPGADGSDAPDMPPAAATPGNDGHDACSSADPVPGGGLAANICGADQSIGGSGGPGHLATGDSGQPGQTGALGAAGTGEPVSGGWSCAAFGTGQGGDDGPVGDVGTAGGGDPAISTDGYHGVDGGKGGAGKPGQGGGGGGGTKGGATICSGVAGPGASGSSGGPGGCGGAGGGGGKAGGASIALVSAGAAVMLTDCALQAGAGADGGRGGNSQTGAAGGAPGTPGKGSSTGGGSKNACSGGAGGQGGSGGPGGGGEGGASIAIAYSGSAPKLAGKTTTKHGKAGAGGNGGNADASANHGDAGLAIDAKKLKAD